MTLEVIAYIGIGSNIEPHKHILNGLERLGAYPGVTVTAVSNFYITPAIDRPDQEDYRNGVWEIHTTHTPEDIKKSILLTIEESEGRVRTTDRYAARTLDLDLIWYDDMVIESVNLTLPDPDILTRSFLSVPLMELCGDIPIPGSNLSLNQVAPQKNDLTLDDRLTQTLQARLAEVQA